jgi:hypothetical protein
MNTKLFSLLLLSIALPFFLFAQTKAENQTVKVHCTYQLNPPTIKFHWPADANAQYYVISKKEESATSWGPAYANLDDTATFYEDTDIEVGKTYEYKFYKNNGIGNLAGYSYKLAGIHIPAIEQRGSILVLIDSLYAAPLSSELERLKKDLIGDGWVPIYRRVGRDWSVTEVKELIQTEVGENESISCVFLFGHIPVPYSGNINPDGHPDHKGAWPADVYYADLDGTWTDANINTTIANRDQNDNIPGDGKFDQSIIPSDIDLEIGRVDLYNLPAFTATDVELMRQYLDKNHQFRHAVFQPERRGLVDDHFTGYDEGFSQTGWRYFSGMFGASNVSKADYFGTLGTESYLWAYGCGGGSYTSCSGVGKTNDFASNTVKAVFSPLFGSYFGDWDAENNFLRAPLAAEDAPLASFWAGRPHWHLHHMDLGRHIGFSTRLTQNNNTIYTAGYAARWIHVALMGDPSLRMHIVSPPESLQADSVGNARIQLNWTASTDPDVLGYEVFRSPALNSQFEKINDQPIAGTTYTDEAALNGKNIYMIRALKLEESGSGSYYNLSQGIIDSSSAYWRVGLEEKQSFTLTAYPNPTKDDVHIHINSIQGDKMEIRLFNSLGQKIFTQQLADGETTFDGLLHLAKYGKGVYTIEVKTDQQSSIKRIICE